MRAWDLGIHLFVGLGVRFGVAGLGNRAKCTGSTQGVEYDVQHSDTRGRWSAGYRALLVEFRVVFGFRVWGLGYRGQRLYLLTFLAI